MRINDFKIKIIEALLDGHLPAIKNYQKKLLLLRPLLENVLLYAI